jgi:hypothetical protein
MTKGSVKAQGVEWVGGQDASAELERDARGWPLLHSNEPCDGSNPLTGRACVNGYHKGHHRDVAGTEWLDD